MILRGLLGAGTFYSTFLAFQIGALSVTMLLFYTNRLWALFMGAFFLKKHLTGERIACVITAIVGMAMLINPWGAGITFSHLFGLVAGVMGGANSVY